MAVRSDLIFHYVYSNELGAGIRIPTLKRTDYLLEQWHQLQLQMAWCDVVLSETGGVETTDILAAGCFIPLDLQCFVCNPDYLRLPFFAQSYADKKYYCLVPSQYTPKLAEKLRELVFSDAACKRFFHSEGIPATEWTESILGVVYKGTELQPVRIGNLSNRMAQFFFDSDTFAVKIPNTEAVRRFGSFYARAKRFVSVLKKSAKSQEPIIIGAEVSPEEVSARYLTCSGLDAHSQVFGKACPDFFNNYCRAGQADLKTAILGRGWHCPCDRWR
jgi:hypothetical protein